MCSLFEAKFAKRLYKKHKGFDDTFYLDEAFVKINDIQYYLWRAIDQGGDVVDAFLQKRPDGTAAKHLFKRLLKHNEEALRKIVTDKLKSYCLAHRKLIANTLHDTTQYANNRAECSHQPTRVRLSLMETLSTKKLPSI